MSHEPFDTHAAAYVLGALDGEDLAEFEIHLAEGCARCEATLRDSGEALAGLAREAPAAVPPPHVRATLLARAARDGAAARATRRSWVPWAVATAVAAVAAAAFTGMFVAGHYEARIGQFARETAAIRERLRQEDARLRQEVAVYQSLVALLRDPATRVVTLGGQGPAPSAYGRVVWNPTSGGHLFVAALPPTPAGKTYELWTIARGTPRPAGVFAVDATGQASQPITATGGNVDVFAVTREPAGGVPAPTGPIVLASK